MIESAKPPPGPQGPPREEPISEPIPEEEDDEEQTHKKRLVGQMAGLNEVRFGASTERPVLPKVEHEVEEEGEEELEKDQPEGVDGQTARQRVAAKLGSMNRMQIGMVSSAVLSKPSA